LRVWAVQLNGTIKLHIDKLHICFIKTCLFRYSKLENKNIYKIQTLELKKSKLLYFLLFSKSIKTIKNPHWNRSFRGVILTLQTNKHSLLQLFVTT